MTNSHSLPIVSAVDARQSADETMDKLRESLLEFEPNDGFEKALSVVHGSPTLQHLLTNEHVQCCKLLRPSAEKAQKTKVRQLAHVQAQLTDVIASGNSTRSTMGGSHIAPMWNTLLGLRGFSSSKTVLCEFELGVLHCLERRIQTEIGDTFQDFDGDGTVPSVSPWTDQGKQLEQEYRHGLLSSLSGANCGDGPLAVFNRKYPRHQVQSVFDALDLLKKIANPVVGVHIDVVKGMETDLWKAVQECFLIPKGRWWQSWLLRTFAIGLKDLAKKGDHKAISFCLCAFMASGPSADGPLCWLDPWVTLFGPHIHKLTGDSDSLIVTSRRLQKVMDTVLPSVLSELVLFEEEIKHSLWVANQLKTSMLGVFVSVGPTCLSGIFHFIPHAIVGLMHLVR